MRTWVCAADTAVERRCLPAEQAEAHLLPPSPHILSACGGSWRNFSAWAPVEHADALWSPYLAQRRARAGAWAHILLGLVVNGRAAS